MKIFRRKPSWFEIFQEKGRVVDITTAEKALEVIYRLIDDSRNDDAKIVASLLTQLKDAHITNGHHRSWAERVTADKHKRELEVRDLQNVVQRKHRKILRLKNHIRNLNLEIKTLKD